MAFDGQVPDRPLEHVPAPVASGVVGPQRPSVGLPVLRELGAEVPLARWLHWLVAVEATGRVLLPVEARPAGHGEPVELRAVCCGLALVLRTGGPGSVVRVDGRGRFALPAWLRQASGSSVLIAARRGDTGLVVLVAPSVVIDGVADGLVGEVG